MAVADSMQVQTVPLASGPALFQWKQCQGVVIHEYTENTGVALMHAWNTDTQKTEHASCPLSPSSLHLKVDSIPYEAHTPSHSFRCSLQYAVSVELHALGLESICSSSSVMYTAVNLHADMVRRHA